MNPSPAAAPWPRLATLLTGGAALFWLSIEDPALWPPLVLGAAFASTLTLRIVAGRLRGPTAGPARRLLLTATGGFLAGLCAGPFAVGLMQFKNYQHAHSIPDFSAGQLLAVLQLAPQMALAGALTGLGLGLAGLVLRGLPRQRRRRS